uniref:Uncharacterized protein n=1 Tax=Ixodes ricinus TaxID=34613 RepID=A0A0K8R306_IXORI
MASWCRGCLILPPRQAPVPGRPGRPLGKTCRPTARSPTTLLARAAQISAICEDQGGEGQCCSRAPADRV